MSDDKIMEANVNADEINVEDIMKSIRKQIKDNGIDKQKLNIVDREGQAKADKIAARYNSDPNAKIVDKDHVEESLRYLSCNYEVQPYELLEGNKIKVFIKKVVRKMASFFVLPIVRQQNTLNYNYYKVIESIYEANKTNNELKSQIGTLEEQVKEISEKIKLFEGEGK